MAGAHVPAGRAKPLVMLLTLSTIVRSDWNSANDGDPDAPDGDHDALRAQMNQVCHWPAALHPKLRVPRNANAMPTREWPPPQLT